MMPYFDQPENQPYVVLLRNYQFPWAVSCGLDLLNRVQQSDPTNYSTPKGTPFYFMGIAAFASHDYQTATFFFDAAVSEDVQHHAGDNDQPALVFMRLDRAKQGETAAQQIVDIVVNKLDAALKDYAGRNGRRPLTLQQVRDHFLNHLERPHLRMLTTTFVSFLAEWEYRLKMIDLPVAEVSREPFFTHLFRGCLLFESLLKDKAPTPVPESFLTRLGRRCLRKKKMSHQTLASLLGMHRNALGIGRKVKTSSSSFEEIVLKLKANEPMRAAMECTARTRNTLAHDLAWTATSLNRSSYDLLANNIAASCLHAIACLYVPPKS